MPEQVQTRIHPETGVELVRGVRETVIRFRGQEEVISLPGWYSKEDLSGEHGLHDTADMKVSDRAINAMKARALGVMTPDEVRRVRKTLKLTQRMAGQIIGGGPNAFQKYEAGEVVLSKAVNTALRLLSSDPSRLSEIMPDGANQP